MSGSVGKSKNESQAQNNFAQNVFGPQAGALEGLYGQASNLFGQMGGKGGFGGQNQFGQDIAQGALEGSLQGQQDQLAGGAYGGMGLQDQLSNSLRQSFNSPTAMQQINNQIMGGAGNNYADVMRGQYIQDADLASQNMLRNLDARATGSGMSGGARQGVATRGGFEDINRNLQRNLAQTGFSAFDKDLDRKLNIAQQADQNTFGRQQLLSGMIGNQNQAQQGGMNFGGNLAGFGNQQQMQPWQQLGAYSNILGSPTVLGQGSGFQSGSGKGFGISGSGGK